MNTSNDLSNLAGALAKAQGLMEGAVKSSSNPFFKSHYADLHEVISVIREPFSLNGLAVVQTPSITDGKVTVTTRLMHASGEWVESEISATPVKNDVQAIGSTITYLRRYALSACAGVAQKEDDGQSAVGQPTNTTTNEWTLSKVEKVITPETLSAGRSKGVSQKTMVELFKEMNGDQNRVREYIKRLEMKSI